LDAAVREATLTFPSKASVSSWQCEKKAEEVKDTVVFPESHGVFLSPGRVGRFRSVVDRQEYGCIPARAGISV